MIWLLLPNLFGGSPNWFMPNVQLYVPTDVHAAATVATATEQPAAVITLHMQIASRAAATALIIECRQ